MQKYLQMASFLSDVTSEIFCKNLVRAWRRIINSRPLCNGNLEHNLGKNVSKGPAFLWQTQIQTIKFGFNNAYNMDINERSYTDTSLIYTLWYEFSYNFDAKSDFGKDFVTKKSTHLDHSYLKYALVKDLFLSLQ